MGRVLRKNHVKAPESGPSEVPLDGSITQQIALASERVTSAQTLAQLRHTELQIVLAQVRSMYEENGKFDVIEIDASKGIVRRRLRTCHEQRATESDGGESPKG
jgi:hypothetical protein